MRTEMGVEPSLRHRLGGSDRTRRRREGEEERVPLCVYLDAAPSRTGFADETAVLDQRLVVGLRSQLVQQPRRALDVGEEECDGAGRELGAHTEIMCQT
jgi:hypothetical protein